MTQKIVLQKLSRAIANLASDCENLKLGEKAIEYL